MAKLRRLSDVLQNASEAEVAGETPNLMYNLIVRVGSTPTRRANINYYEKRI